MSAPALHGSLAWSRPGLRGWAHLTQRGQLVLAAGLIAVGSAVAVPTVVATAAVGDGPTWAALPAAAPGAVLAESGLARPYVVQRGDTLWALATSMDPTGDPRILVDRILELSALEDALLMPGQRLWLPMDAVIPAYE